jgi:hypothetical protein
LVLNDNQLTERFCEENKERIKKFEQKAIVEEIRKIYMDVADSAVEHS